MDQSLLTSSPTNEFGNEDVYAFVPRERMCLSRPNQAKAEGVSGFHFSRMSLMTSTPAIHRSRWRLPVGEGWLGLIWEWK
jgi:hypothetical protein